MIASVCLLSFYCWPLRAQCYWFDSLPSSKANEISPATMEHSSPLAAMQPPSVLLGHCFRPERPSYPSCGPRSGLGPSPFNFKDLSMKKGQNDCFNVKPVRGSSPTASLAADLSQNFHIDQRCVRSFCYLDLCHVSVARSLFVVFHLSCLKSVRQRNKLTPKIVRSW